MEEIINLLVQNGIGIVCVGYLIYDRLKYSKGITESLENVNKSLAIMNERILNLEKEKKEK